MEAKEKAHLEVVRERDLAQQMLKSMAEEKNKSEVEKNAYQEALRLSIEVSQTVFVECHGETVRFSSSAGGSSGDSACKRGRQKRPGNAMELDRLP